jgi:hypothetical protein
LKFKRAGYDRKGFMEQPDALTELLISEICGPQDTAATARAQLEASTRSMDAFFEQSEIDCGTDSALNKAGHEKGWDVWFSPEAADCPAEGGGYYKRTASGLVKI